MRISVIFRILSIPRKFWRQFVLFALCLSPLGALDLNGADIRVPKVAVLVSRDIRPYIQAVEGISAVLKDKASAEVEVFSLEQIKGKSRDLLLDRLSNEAFALFIAIGPEAVKTVSEQPASGKIPWLYAMILNPPGVFENVEAVCGVPLDIPALVQLEIVTQGLPGVTRLGLLYDPRYNNDFFAEAAGRAELFNLEIVPLTVSSKKDIPAVLKEHLGDIDALWLIPDQTVISERIVQYIIKEALFRQTPVIGYNRFFYESGAALAFVFDYEELGMQTGRMAADVLFGKACVGETPVFRVWQNLRVINKLGIAVPEERTPPIEAGP